MKPGSFYPPPMPNLHEDTSNKSKSNSNMPPKALKASLTICSPSTRADELDLHTGAILLQRKAKDGPIPPTKSPPDQLLVSSSATLLHKSVFLSSRPKPTTSSSSEFVSDWLHSVTLPPDQLLSTPVTVVPLDPSIVPLAAVSPSSESLCHDPAQLLLLARNFASSLTHVPVPSSPDHNTNSPSASAPNLAS
ncbi:hypothetical protein JRO89_XS12G0265400 [Xanthoceras sorbifolium]|uniref:Uncharacterized protein n=1 Tax=Xanthoceras sorbifolium TaxID=99658 RepID=A0ABQ8HDV5_9ROSI|nr:hypothetical protein JRO89_XS12G0265400 [Xanthoceras sorbifolium]